MGAYDKIYKFQNKRCFYCKCPYKIEDLEKEHVYPKSKGGRGLANKVLSCTYCNRLKAALSIEQFMDAVLLLPPNHIHMAILDTLKQLQSGKYWREGWHKNAQYQFNGVDKMPTKTP